MKLLYKIKRKLRNLRLPSVVVDFLFEKVVISFLFLVGVAECEEAGDMDMFWDIEQISYLWFLFCVDAYSAASYA